MDSPNGRQGLSRRRFFQVLVVSAAGASLLQACAQPSPPTAAPPTAAAPTPPPSAATTPPAPTANNAAPTVAPAATSAPAPTTVQAAGTPARGGTLVIGLPGSPLGLDPHLLTDTNSMALFEQLYTAPRTLDPNLKLQPDLAISVTADSPTQYTLKVRPGVNFQNGRALVADDLKYSINRLIDPQTNALLASWYAMVQSMDTPDPATLVVTLKDADASFMSNLAHRRPSSIVPQEAVAQYGDLKTTAVGTGPFKLTGLTPDVGAKMVRNPDYYRAGHPYLDGLEFRVLPDEPSRLAALRNGDIHLTQFLDPQNSDLARSDPNLVVVEQPGLFRNALAMNNRKKPFDDMRVRQAIALAFDRDQIIALGSGGKGQVTGVIPPAETAWATPVSELSFYGKPDLDQARSLLNDAGYGSGFSFTYLAWSSFAQVIPTAQVMQAQLKQVGIDMQIVPADAARIQDAQRTVDYDTLSGLFTGRPDPEVYIGVVYRTGSSANISGYSSPTFDTMANQARGETDPTMRQSLYADLQKLISHDVPDIYMYVSVLSEAMSKKVMGYQQIVTGYRTNLEDVWLQA